MNVYARYLSEASPIAKIGYIFGLAIVMLFIYVAVAQVVGPLDTFLSQILMAFFVFYLPAIILAFLFHKNEESSFDYLSQTCLPSSLSTLLAIVAMLVAIPTINAITALNQMVCPPDKEMMDNMVAMLVGGDTSLYLVKLLAVALIPALTEEMFFRGLLQNTLARYMSPVAAIAITALVFSLAHGDLSGAVPRFFMGAFLGWLLSRSGSLWLSSIAHFVNNAAIVTCYHYCYCLQTHSCFIDSTFSIPATLLSVFLLVLCIYGIYRLTKEKI